MESDGGEEFLGSSDLLESAMLYDKKLALTAKASGSEVRVYPVKRLPGFAILLASDRTPAHKPQNTFYRDLKIMERALSGCQWRVESPYLEKGAGDEEQEAYLDGTSFRKALDVLCDSSSQFEPYSCFMLYYSGHGAADGVILSDGQCIPYREIVATVASIPSLVEKPKIFIFDCCRYGSATTSSSSFSAELEKMNLSSSEGYPPQHCVIAFSAAENAFAVGVQNAPSIFTLQLAHALPEFSSRLSFGEILVQVAGMTRRIAQSLQRIQRPVYCSTLTRLLLLNDVRKKIEYEALCANSSTGASAFEKGMYRPLESKLSPERDHVLSPVVTDVVVGHVPVFSSRNDVMSNLSRLGEGKSVFICYAPDPESPYFNPREREGEIHRNELTIASLVLDLELHGFHVVSDLHMQDTEPADFLQWYVSRISFCSYVLLICSPAFNEIFSVPRAEAIVDKRAQLLMGYKRAVHGELMKEVMSQGNASRFIPVILEARWDDVGSIPLLFQGGYVYRLCENERRTFNYDDLTRDFEKLVCRMAGVDRMALSRPQERGVHKLTGGLHSSSSSSSSTGYYHAQRISRPKGYKFKTSRVVKYCVTSLEAEYEYVSHKVQSAEIASYPPVTVSLHFQQLPLPSPPPGPQPPLLPQLPHPEPSSLPNEELDPSIVLWLAQSLTSWKFIGRFLNLDESDLHRIEYECRGDFTEQCHAMIITWGQRRPEEYNYRVFAEALWKDEKARPLYAEYARRVLELNT